MTLTTHDIARELQADNNANWSWAGALALAEYLEELEESTGEEMEFDAVAIRCDFAQYDSLQAWAEEYFGSEDKKIEELDIELDDDGDVSEDDDSIEDKIREFITDNGQLLEFDGGIIVSSF